MTGQIHRSSFSPPPLPANDQGWHGKPAQKMSTGSTVHQSTWVMSPRFFTPGWW
jgi:hypothetical protein